MAITFACYTLRGNVLEKGIPVEDKAVMFSPRWGMSRRVQQMAHLIDIDADIDLVEAANVALVNGAVIIRQGRETCVSVV